MPLTRFVAALTKATWLPSLLMTGAVALLAAWVPALLALATMIAPVDTKPVTSLT